MKKTLTLFCLCFGLSFGTASVVQAGDALADRHGARSVSCDACHGQNMSVKSPNREACTTCHPLESTASRTADIKPVNPHENPHQPDIECMDCHSGHGTPQNYCGSCHNFEFKVP